MREESLPENTIRHWAIVGVELRRFEKENGKPKTAPVFRCQACGELIEDMDKGQVEWDEREGKAYVMHKGKFCDHLSSKEHLNSWTELRHMWKRLGLNGGLDPDEKVDFEDVKSLSRMP